jgi:hypothetical protein
MAELILPKEIWLRIFSFSATLADLAVKRAVCQAWKRMLDSPDSYGIGREKLLAPLRLLARVCISGCLASARWCSSVLGMTRAGACMDGNYILHNACERGHTEVIKWLISRYQLTAEDIRSRSNYALAITCRRGHAELAKWLVETFGLSAEDALKGKNNSAFCGACADGRYEMAKWLVAELKLGPHVNKYTKCLRLSLAPACSGGHFDVVKWLIAEIRKDEAHYGCGSYDDDSEDLINCLRGACNNEYLDVAELLATEFDLGDIVRGSDYTLLGHLCKKGKLNVVKWLMVRFGLDARTWDNYALKKACKHGHLRVVKWLMEDLGLNGEDALGGEPDALWSACSKDRLDIVQYLVTKFPEVRDELRHGAYLSVACGLETLDLARWLVAELGPSTTADRRNMYYYLLRGACEGGKYDQAVWLATSVGLTAEDLSRGRHIILALCCARKGLWSLAKWLVAEYGPAVDDLRGKYVDMLQAACEEGDLDTVKWLTIEVGLSDSDVRSGNNTVFCTACEHGHLPVSKWLADVYGFTIEDVICDNVYANGHTDVADWLDERFG